MFSSVVPAVGEPRSEPTNTASLISPRQELAHERSPEQSKKEPGKTRPASSRARIPGLCSETSPKNLHPSETLCLDKPTRLTRRGFRDADFFGASSVASALDRCTGRVPDTLSPHHSMTDLPPCCRNTGTQISLKERTCPIYARQLKQHWIREISHQMNHSIS